MLDAEVNGVLLRAIDDRDVGVRAGWYERRGSSGRGPGCKSKALRVVPSSQALEKIWFSQYSFPSPFRVEHGWLGAEVGLPPLASMREQMPFEQDKHGKCDD